MEISVQMDKTAVVNVLARPISQEIAWGIEKAGASMGFRTGIHL